MSYNRRNTVPGGASYEFVSVGLLENIIMRFRQETFVIASDLIDWYIILLICCTFKVNFGASVIDWSIIE